MIAERLATPDDVVQKEVGESFYSALAKEANKLVEVIKPGVLITPIQHPAQGDFNWVWKDRNDNFNAATFDDISARILRGSIEGTAKMTGGSGFPNAYTQLIAGIAFTLSKDDQKKLNEAKANADAQAQALVGTYQEIYGWITDEQMKTAGEKIKIPIRTKLDYVILYIMGAVWSGRLRQNKEPVTWMEMYEAKDLRKLLPYMDPSGEPVLTTVRAYLAALGPVTALVDQLTHGGWTIQQMKENTRYPSEKNGGMKLVNPSGPPDPTYRVGYNIAKDIAEIKNDLGNEGRVIELKMSVKRLASGQLNVVLHGGGGGTFDVGQVLSFGIKGEFEHDLNAFAGTSSTCEVTIKLDGVTLVPCEPASWRSNSNRGWFYADPIAQAWKNWQRSGGKPDVTGFNFTTEPAFNLNPLDKGGDFGLLKYVLISKHPSIEVSYKEANYELFKASWKDKVTGNLKLLGLIPLGGFGKGVYASSHVEGHTKREFTIKFKESGELITVPDLQKTAYVIGGAFSFPGSPGSGVEPTLLSV